MTCNSCGVDTERPETFIKHRRSFSRKERHYCPSCWRRKQIKEHSFAHWLVVGYGILGAILAWRVPNEHMGWILVNLFLFQLFTIAVTLPHELGHAFAGQWVGFRVFKIIVGAGKPIWKGKLFGFDNEIGTVPLGGFA